MAKSGKVVIVGRPNAGKSTLLNSLISQKMSITSPRPQTTRKSVRVKFSDERGQIIFSDTPGLMEKVEDMLGRRINAEIPKELATADLILHLIDLSRSKGDEENKVIGLVRRVEKVPRILVYNKIDIAKGGKNRRYEYQFLEDEYDANFSVSAKKGTHLKGLLNLLFEYLPEGKANRSGGGKLMSQNPREFVAEIIREKAYLNLRNELPYTIGVEVGEIRDRKDILVIKAVIYATTDKYKAMVIGRGGKKIRQIGFEARKELALLRDKKVYLALRVETDKHWVERMM